MFNVRVHNQRIDHKENQNTGTKRDSNSFLSFELEVFCETEISHKCTRYHQKQVNRRYHEYESPRCLRLVTLPHLTQEHRQHQDAQAKSD